jgi:hypothetical protein
MRMTVACSLEAHDRCMRQSALSVHCECPCHTQFVAIGKAVMQGSKRVATAEESHNFAKRIARALNETKQNSRGY